MKPAWVFRLAIQAELSIVLLLLEKDGDQKLHFASDATYLVISAMG